MVTVNAKPEAKSTPQKAHPSGDNRFKILEATMKRHQYQPDALIEVLHSAQQLFGFLEDDVLLHIAHSLKIPPSKVYGVATFYHFFSLKPQGKHTCVVCIGTACYVKGGGDILKQVGDYAGIKSGETTADNNLSLMGARCVGACGIAPVVVMDGTVSGLQSSESILNQVKGWFENGS
ncbi:MAG TPA: bidirectional hydrogenase complex protein HoxE [Capsulimonadaceae bacterium]|jgi:bidirectional [NiFe] hydrogenase diaphorase subunit